MGSRNSAGRVTFLCAALFSVNASCARHNPAALWAPLPAYSVGPEVGTACSRAPETLPSNIVTTVDVLIDSLAGSALTEVRIVGEPLRPEERQRVTPVVAVTLLYPKPGYETLRETWAVCAVSLGITLRVNAALVRRAGLGVASDGPVRVTVRSIDGRLLGAPIITTPGSAMQVVRWASVKGGP
jgi:hypothetical protein